MVNISTNVYAKFRCDPLRIKRALFFGPERTDKKEEEEELEWLFGTRLPGPKISVRSLDWIL